MWLDFHELDTQQCSLLMSIGRALAIAQNFEANCKFVLMIIEVEKALEDKRCSSLQAARPVVDELLQLMLGRVVTRFGRSGEISQAELDILVAAKNARNYVAHGAAFELVICRGPYGKSFNERMTRFEQEVGSLTEGDGLVSLWSHYIQEHEQAPMTSYSYRRPPERGCCSR
jgi:hypothetical protein